MYILKVNIYPNTEGSLPGIHIGPSPDENLFDKRKMANVKSICTKLDASQVTITDVAQALGYMVSSFPGVMFGPLYFRQLERDKMEALKCNKGVFDAFMTISDTARQGLEWWVMHVDSTNSYNVISHGEPTIVLFTHVSFTGWGCSLNNISTGGNWTAEEANNHLNYLELLGVFLVLQSFSLTIKRQRVKVMVDNITALSDLNHMGTRLPHSPLEWTLVNTVFKDCISELNVLPTIDLFLSTKNNVFLIFSPHFL